MGATYFLSLRSPNTNNTNNAWNLNSNGNLWAVTSDPAEEWPAWSPPLGAHDAYSAGDKVSHNGKHWTSAMDGNVWEPGTYGWDEITE